MMNQKYFVDVKSEHGLANYADTLKTGYQPLDLSRLCDSVETIKTPSPYSSPSMASTTTTSSHQSDSVQYSYNHRSHNSQYPDCQSAYAYQKRDSMTADECYEKQTSNISPFLLQAAAAALQQRISQHLPLGESNKSLETNFINENILNTNPFQMLMGRDGKISRPFKVYPSDPLAMASFSVVSAESAEKFETIRSKALKRIRGANDGQACVTNPKMRRVFETKNNADSESMTNKDSAYYERRRKNNEAAKKSRDRRKRKENQIAVRAVFLETENRELQAELSTARNQVAELKTELLSLQKQLAMNNAKKYV